MFQWQLCEYALEVPISHHCLLCPTLILSLSSIILLILLKYSKLLHLLMGEILTCTGTCIQYFSKDGRWLVTRRLDGHEAFFPQFLWEHSNCAGSTSIFQQTSQFSVLGTSGPCVPRLWTTSWPESNVVLWFCSALRIWINNSEVHRCYCVAGDLSICPYTSFQHVKCF